MRETGFSEINNERIKYKGGTPWYIEIALTGKCNFRCSYCNSFSIDVDIDLIANYFNTFEKCKHIQLTGGEPSLHPDFREIVRLCKTKANKVGISTNGTYGIEKYLSLGVDMFSISLDDYDTDILLERGYKCPKLIIKTITELSKHHYVNVGVVVDGLNVKRIEHIVDYILSLGVADIKLSISTKEEVAPIFIKRYKDYPILDYRVQNFKKYIPMRGWPTEKCWLASHDISIVGNKHYPCLVYFREGGTAIGTITGDVLAERSAWVSQHNATTDPICKKYCMDFKCEFNHEKTKHHI
jgi:MoaA/NifB/PqqE/SkfB family radical SAM enzyme